MHGIHEDCGKIKDIFLVGKNSGNACQLFLKLCFWIDLKKKLPTIYHTSDKVGISIENTQKKTKIFFLKKH